MTRKQYIHSVQRLLVAIYNNPGHFSKGYKLGEALKHVRDNSKDVPKKFGSYEAAWNCEAMKWARDYYGVD